MYERSLVTRRYETTSGKSYARRWWCDHASEKGPFTSLRSTASLPLEQLEQFKRFKPFKAFKPCAAYLDLFDRPDREFFNTLVEI
jgi:hypothetical protein